MEEKKNSRDHPMFDQFRRGEMIHSQAKRVILNVFAHLSTVGPDKSWNKIADETAVLVGTSAKTVLLLKNEKLKSIDGQRPTTTVERRNQDSGDEQSSVTTNANQGIAKRKRKAKRSESPRSKKRKYTQVQKKRIDRYDESVLNAIRSKMRGYSERGVKPSFVEVLEEVNADTRLPIFSKFTFRCLLRDMGLKGYCRGRWPDKVDETNSAAIIERGRNPKRTENNRVKAPAPDVLVNTNDPETSNRSVTGHFLSAPSYVNDNYLNYQHAPPLSYNNRLSLC